MAHLKASIDFGLVHIPVEIVTAEDRQDKISFHMLDSKDLSRIRLKRVNENSGKEVEWEDIVKGYEVSDGKYVVFTDEELDELEAESNQSLAIDAFVEKDEIEPGLFDTPYYLVPGKGGEKGYVLLEKVLEKSGKYAVIQAVLYNKERLGVLYASSGGLMMGVLRYPEDIKKPQDVLPPALSRVSVNAKEVAMAERLLKEMSAKFKPANYKDDYAAKLRTAIKNKTKSKKPISKVVKEKSSKKDTLDISDLLAQSLKGRPKKSAGKKAA